MVDFTLTMLEQWHQNEEYEKVVEALENVIPEDMTDNLYGQLARALSYLQRYDEALDALDHVSEEGRDDIWWYRRGYALFYLEQYEEARRALETVVEINPNDLEAADFAEDCAEMMLRQKNKVPFRQRVEIFWREFEAKEALLRSLMDEERIEEAVNLTNSLLTYAFHDAYFELGKNEDRYELVLTAEGQRHRLFSLQYWWDHTPETLLELWDFHVGRKRAGDLEQWKLQMFDMEVSASCVRVWAELTEDKVDLYLYSPELIPGVTMEEDKAYSLAEILLDQALGECVAINTIAGLELLEEPMEGEGRSLSELYDFVKQNCSDWDADPTDGYMTYRAIPQENWRLREDVIAGSSCVNRLINEYYNEEREAFTESLEDGVVFGFLFYNHDEMDPFHLINCRNAIEEALEERGEDFCRIIGGATGTYYTYIDVVCFDQIEFLTLATELLNEHEELREMGFSEFIMGGVETDLKLRKTASYTQSQKESILQHIEDHFGHIDHLVTDFTLSGMLVDLAVIFPDQDRKYYTICTVGMGAHRMEVPYDLRRHGLDRAELFVTVCVDEDWVYPWLRDLAKLPARDNTWLGYGHTIPNGKPISDDTKLSGGILTSAAEFGEEAGECTLFDGTCITFYKVIPLYEEEIKYQLQYGAEAFLDLLKEDRQEEGDPKISDLHRPNLCQWQI